MSEGWQVFQQMGEKCPGDYAVPIICEERVKYTRVPDFSGIQPAFFCSAEDKEIRK
jgi:hypothetical protein